MSFLILKERGNPEERRLMVVRDSLDVIPDFNVNITDLNKKVNGQRYKHFFDNGYGGITFKCQIKIRYPPTSNFTGTTPSIVLLHKWYVDKTPLMIATEAIDIPHDDSLYIITKNPSRKQSSDNYTTWDLEFTSYTPLNVVAYKNDNSAIKKALNKAKNSKNKAKTPLTQKLKACYIVHLTFSKKKKSHECVKILQKVLKKNGCYINGKIDGWYGPDTRGAVGGFQFSKKLKVTGKVDLKTFQKLCDS